MNQDMSENVNGKTDNFIQTYSWQRNLQESTGESYANVEQIGQGTGQELQKLRRQVANIEVRIEEIQEEIDTGKALPENIYQLIGDVEEQAPSESVVLKIRELLKIGLQHLEEAQHAFEEEIERESEIDLFFSTVRNISFIPLKSVSFEDAITALLVSLQSNVTEVYSREKILALKEITNILINNIMLSEKELDACVDLLEEAGFDLTFPLQGMDFDELQ